MAKCPFCKKDVTDDSGGIKCDKCARWYHYDCISQKENIPGLPLSLQDELSDQEISYCCQTCKGENFLQQLYDGKHLAYEDIENMSCADRIQKNTSVTTTAVSSVAPLQQGNPTFSDMQAMFQFFMTNMENVEKRREDRELKELRVREDKEKREKEERDEKEKREKEERDEKEKREKEERDEKEKREKEERERKEDRDREFMANLVRSLTASRQTNSDTTAAGSNVQAPRENLNGEAGNSRRAKLPNLEIPKFSGLHTEWLNFWEIFSSQIGNSNFSDVDKFTYLNMYLVGPAKELINGLSCDNYDAAVEILRKKYGNKRNLIDNEFQVLANLPTVQSDLNNLPSFTAKLVTCMRNIEKLGLPADGDWVTSFRGFIVNKIPKDLCSKFFQTLQDDQEYGLCEIRDYLQTVSSAQERVAASFGKRSETATPKTAGPTTGAALLQSENSSARFQCGSVQNVPVSSPPWSCPFCQSENQHYASKCPRLPEPGNRRQRLMENRRCFKCLRQWNRSHQCPPNIFCHLCKKRGHVQLMCPTILPEFKSARETEVAVGTIPQSSATQESSPSLVALSNERVIMLTTVGCISGIGGSERILVNVYIDPGSTISYIREDILHRLTGSENAKFKHHSVNRIGGTTDVQSASTTIQLHFEKGFPFSLHVYTLPTISSPVHIGPINLCPELLCKIGKKRISNLATPCDSTFIIDLLIGMNYFNQLVKFGQAQQLSPKLSLTPSRFGYLLLGTQLCQDMTSCIEDSFVSVLNCSQVESDTIQRMWDLETMGIKDNPQSSDDEFAQQQFDESVQQFGSRYYVKWPWRNLENQLSDNFYLAWQRLQTFYRKRLMDQPQLLGKYQATLDEQEKMGIIERVPESEVSSPKFLCSYIPHHAVIKETSNTTKVRVVYDASAKQKGQTAVNDHLLRGPVLLQNLCGLLIRFQVAPIALTSDIEKAFLQVGLQESQRDVCRFIWLLDHTLSDPLQMSNILVYRFTRVPFGFISSPFLLSATIIHHLDKQWSPLSQDIKNGLYVDNVFLGVETDEEAIQTYKRAKRIFEEAAMNLREWTSNSGSFVEMISEEDKAPSGPTKVLGITWNPNDDTVSVCSAPNEFSMTVATKRSVLHEVAKIFDPLGWFSPILLPAKLLLQQLWIENFDWDETLNLEKQKRWVEIHHELLQISDEKLPRQMFPGSNSPKRIQLHCFSDASPNAYGACIYAMSETSVRLVLAKTKLCPTKGTTLPRLELLGVLIGTKLAKLVNAELVKGGITVNCIHLWCDSQIVLGWISSNKLRSIFVENRLKEIRSVPGIVFHYVSSSDNPADLLTRGASLSMLGDSNWWKGPKWITNSTESSEIWNRSQKGFADNQLEQRKTQPVLFSEPSCVETQVQSPLGIDQKQFSSFRSLLRTTALSLRFIKNCRLPENERQFGCITPNELEAAKYLWIQYAQESAFICMKQDMKANTPNDQVKALDIRLDDEDILRCYGRQQFAEIQCPFPVLLPKNNWITWLIIKDVHDSLFHSGPAQTLMEFRKFYWVQGGRNQVNKVLHRCSLCRRYEGPAFRPPPMAPLPPNRVQTSPSFTHVGVDYMGPLYTSDNGKNYVCLFTCMATRAVHLEIVRDLKAETFLKAFTRFTSRRRLPATILSDRAKYFRTAKQAILRHQVEPKERLHSASISQSKTEWYFLPSASPWMGGFYERLIQSVKKTLRKTLHGSRITHEDLHTTVVAVESLINARPLTYVGSSVKDFQPLTPSDLLTCSGQMWGQPLSPETVENPDFSPEPTGNQIHVMYYKQCKLLDTFWNIWKNDYLTGLREQRLKPPGSFRKELSRIPEVGEIVLLKEKTPRAMWPMGRIVKNRVSKDGFIRSVTVIKTNGKGAIRPVTKIIPLELEPNSHPEPSVGNHSF